MSKNIILLFLTFVFTLFITVACSNQSSNNDAENNEVESNQSNEDENQENNSENEENETNTDSTQNDDGSDSVNEDDSSNDQTNEEDEQSDSSSDSASSNNKELPETIVIDEQIQHEEGVTFTLEQINFKEDHITVDFNAENFTGYSQYLASAGRAKGQNLGGITLEDDTGFDYRYIADEDSDRIELEDQEKVTGTVSFAGRIQEDATSLTLVFNPDRSLKFSFEDIQIEW
ncbi:hypothetical protein [Gracilibacillus massiliensis]|uniref:hypothetical protein n=1 Tax=Gracilibacillus massiliensis TaxID=1564956 RepID=UPI00071E10CF|nr:hypothetical protein [Gracilibacillus massiliensis]